MSLAFRLGGELVDLAQELWPQAALNELFHLGQRFESWVDKLGIGLELFLSRLIHGSGFSWLEALVLRGEMGKYLDLQPLQPAKKLGLHQQDRIQFFIGCGHVARPSVGCVRTPTVTAGGMALYCSRLGQQPTAATSRGGTR